MGHQHAAGPREPYRSAWLYRAPNATRPVPSLIHIFFRVRKQASEYFLYFAAREECLECMLMIRRVRETSKRDRTVSTPDNRRYGLEALRMCPGMREVTARRISSVS